jgi:hypothetical protein
VGSGGALLAAASGTGKGVDQLIPAHLRSAIDALVGRPLVQLRLAQLPQLALACAALKHANLNCLGRYSFRATVPAGGGLRPLRAPAAGGLDEDDEQP